MEEKILEKIFEMRQLSVNISTFDGEDEENTKNKISTDYVFGEDEVPGDEDMEVIKFLYDNKDTKNYIRKTVKNALKIHNKIKKMIGEKDTKEEKQKIMIKLDNYKLVNNSWYDIGEYNGSIYIDTFIDFTWEYGCSSGFYLEAKTYNMLITPSQGINSFSY